MLEDVTEVMEVAAVPRINDTQYRAEIDQNISTAKAYPRDLTTFQDRVKSMACLTVETASECVYILPPRKGGDGPSKPIEGPSARLAEIVRLAWKNCRTAGRIAEIGEDFVTAQGVFIDAENNVMHSTEVRRRIVDKRGRRYSDDMIAMTCNAACSMATRNALFQGIPRALWSEVYQEARRLMRGDIKSLTARRDAAMEYLTGLGISEERILARLEVKGVPDMTLDHVFTLRGLTTAMRDGDVSAEEAFPDPTKAKPEGTGTGMAGLAAALAPTAPPGAPPEAVAGSPAPAPPATPPEAPTGPTEPPASPETAHGPAPEGPRPGRKR